MQFEPNAEGTQEMFSSPSQVRGSQTTAQRRHNEILSGVQTERQAAQARATSDLNDSIFVTLRQRAGQLLIVAGQRIGGLTRSTLQPDLESKVHQS